MARPLASRLSALRQSLRRYWSGRHGIRPEHAVAVMVVLSVLLLTWIVGSAWVAARSDGAAQARGANGAAPEAQAARQPAVKAIVATLAASSATVMQEDELTLSGSGFRPLEAVVMSAQDASTGEWREIARASADWRGAFEGQSVKLPEWLISGAREIQAAGDSSGIRGSHTVYVRAKDRWVNLGSYGVKQAEKLGWVAGGFEPEEQVNVYLAEGQDRQPGDSDAPILSVPADRAGNTAWTELTVPLVKAGTYSLMFRGASGGQALSRNIVINALVPSVELSPWSGPPGSHVELNGQGFVPGEEVGVYLGDQEDAALTLTADENGEFWGMGPAEVPYEARGPFRVTFIGQASHALVTRSFGVVAPKPWVEMSTYAGFAGTSVFFSGGGFAARERVSIHLAHGNGPTISVGEVNEQGYYRFIGPVNVPPSATDEVTFVLVGESSQAQGAATFKVLTPWVPGLASDSQ